MGQWGSLIETARSVVGQFDLENYSSAGSVAAAVLSESGKVYTGICLDLNCGIGFCAEHSAIAEMLKDRERVIKAVVAVTNDSILPPCGRCRELMAQVSPRNLETIVVLGEDHAVTLGELIPHHWFLNN